MNENAKTKLVLEYTGMDDFSCPVYKDQFGKLWKDIDLGKGAKPNLYSLSFNLLMENLPIPYSRSTHFIRLRIKEVPMNSSTGC